METGAVAGNGDRTLLRSRSAQRSVGGDNDGQRNLVVGDRSGVTVMPVGAPVVIVASVGVVLVVPRYATTLQVFVTAAT